MYRPALVLFSTMAQMIATMTRMIRPMGIFTLWPPMFTSMLDRLRYQPPGSVRFGQETFWVLVKMEPMPLAICISAREVMKEGRCR